MYGLVQVYCGDSSDPVRQASQYVPCPSYRRHDLGGLRHLGGLHPHFFAHRTRRQLHRAPVGWDRSLATASFVVYRQTWGDEDVMKLDY